MCKTISEFARYLGRSESTVKRLIASGVVIALHDGRSVTIPVAHNTKRYLEYLKEREKQHRASKRRAPQAAADESKYKTKYSEIAFATGDFIADHMKPQNVPERSAEELE